MKGAALILTDLALSRRLERCEGRANAAFVEARQRLEPETGAAWIEVAGAYAMFDGSPIASGMLEKLVARGYHPIELTSVMFMGMRTDKIVCPPGVRIANEPDLYADLAAEGWSEFPEVGPYIRGFARVSAAAEGSTPFIAEVDGRPAATGMLIMQNGVALLAGASTIPSARKRGAQRALLEATVVCRRSGLRPGDDVRHPWQRFAAKCGAAGLPHRVYAHQMGAALSHQSR